MDPLTMMILSGLGGLFGGISRTRAQGRENQAAADQENLRRQAELDARNQELRLGGEVATRRAAKLEDLAGIFKEFGQKQNPYARQQSMLAERMMGDDGRGLLQAEAMRQLERGSGMLDGALASRGMYSSGYGVNQQRLLGGEVMGSLAQAIAQSQMQGMQGASNIYAGLGQDDMQRQQMTLAGLQGVYGDQAWGMAGMDMDPYMMDASKYAFTPPKSGFWDFLLGGVAGGFGGAAQAYGANPEAFARRTTTTAANPPAQQRYAGPRGGVENNFGLPANYNYNPDQSLDWWNR
jgi:hypothetical protein